MSTIEFREKGMYQQPKSREEHASSAASFCKEVTELRLASIDSQAATSRPEFKGVTFRKASTGGFARSRNDVHELLDCTVCMNLMHPPIYQVSYSNCDDFQNFQSLLINPSNKKSRKRRHLI